MRYEYILSKNGIWAVSDMCSVLDVSESGYYRFLKTRGKPSRKMILSVAIKEIYEEHPYNDNYGIERIRLALEQRGIVAGKRRIATIMRENGWLHRRRTPHGITKATTEIQEAENLIKQDFSAEKPYTKLLTDITEVQCSNGKLYISPILDCFNGEVLSLAMDNNMKKELAIRTINGAAERYPIRNAILHDDRGSQYTSEAFKNRLAELGITHSLSGVAHCYDNARMESFFRNLEKGTYLQNSCLQDADGASKESCVPIRFRILQADENVHIKSRRSPASCISN